MEDVTGAQDEPQVEAAEGDRPQIAEVEKNLVGRILKKIKSDREFHRKAFDRMRDDMFLAMHGHDKDYPRTSYKANIVGRHVKQKVSALYAKNPKITARRRETLDFKVWDENPQSLQMAMQGVQMAQAAMQATPVAPDPVTGEPVPAAPIIPPEYEQAFAQAQAVLADYTAGMQRREEIKKIGKTLEVLFAQAMREQKPLDFKTGLKDVVRRACTTGVGYVELGFQRAMGPRAGLTEQLADVRTRLDHLRRLAAEVSEGEVRDDDPEILELQMSLEALQAEPEIVLREGLIFDYPQATKVIPDQLCRSLVGFVGARHVTVEYQFSCDEIEEQFGVDLEMNDDGDDRRYWHETTSDITDGDTSRRGKMVTVYKHYDKPSGLVYWVAEGHKGFLRPPAPPDVVVEDFWPIYALTFNAVENEKELFPPSDVTLLKDMQAEYNRSRQGMREHRQAARPRWACQVGMLDEEDQTKLATARPFEVLPLKALTPGMKVLDVLQPVPVPGVDPNLYETGQLFTDIQLVAGSSEAQMGGVAKATATESAIAANSVAAGDQSAVDDLDAFLTVLARAGGQILLREMSPEQVTRVVGPGAVWPQMTLADIADEIYLEVEAGSTGKPNQAVEIQNWQQMLPFLIQMPGIDPTWLARETLRRLDDRMDLTDALASGLPSIVMQNQMKQPGTGDPASDPSAQGPAGNDKATKPAEQRGGSDPAFGSNQVEAPL